MHQAIRSGPQSRETEVTCVRFHFFEVYHAETMPDHITICYYFVFSRNQFLKGGLPCENLHTEGKYCVVGASRQ